MKKLLYGIVLLSFFIMMNVQNTSAQTSQPVQAPLTPEQFSKKFFDMYSTRPIDAIDYIFAQQKMTRDLKNDLTEIKRNLKNTINVLGNYDGYELITEKSINDSFKLMSYMVKYDKSPMRFIFIYYKPKDVWNVFTFQYNANLEDELTDAAGVDKLKQ